MSFHVVPLTYFCILYNLVIPPPTPLAAVLFAAAAVVCYMVKIRLHDSVRENPALLLLLVIVNFKSDAIYSIESRPYYVTHISVAADLGLDWLFICTYLQSGQGGTVIYLISFLRRQFGQPSGTIQLK
jgi:uncharacterized membrane protein YhaH (DUF805 family)